MRGQAVLWVGVVALLAALGWAWHDGRVAGPAVDALRRAIGPGAPEPARLRKCVDAAGAATYTDGPCPAGSRALPVDGGSLTVLPAAPVPPPASAASARSLLRELAPGADGQTLKREHIDRIR